MTNLIIDFYIWTCSLKPRYLVLFGGLLLCTLGIPLLLLLLAASTQKVFVQKPKPLEAPTKDHPLPRSVSYARIPTQPLGVTKGTPFLEDYDG